MIRPVSFRRNEQTAVNNFYQKSSNGLLPATINAKAQNEFDNLVKKLRNVGVNVIVVDDTIEPDTPDSIFPNNWISFHQTGDVVIYPMFAENRRLERREDILDLLEEQGFVINEVMDYTTAEEEGVFLEGTGSMVLDRVNHKAYLALSPRSDEDLFIEFCEDFEFTPIIFNAYHTINDTREEVYHTNIMMSIGDKFAILSSECIDDKTEKKSVVESLKQDGKEIIYISESQMNKFAGNMIQLRGSNDSTYLVMSESAFNSLNKGQIAQIEKYTSIIFSSLETIETYGGGSARCMITEVFLPKN